MAHAFYLKSVVLPLMRKRLTDYEKAIAKFHADHPEPPPETPEQREARIEARRTGCYSFHTLTREEAENAVKLDDAMLSLSSGTSINDILLKRLNERATLDRRLILFIENATGDTVNLTFDEVGDLFARYDGRF